MNGHSSNDEFAEARSLSLQLQKIHHADLVGKDKTSQALREHLKAISMLALGGPFVYEFLADHTSLITELCAIVSSHENDQVVGEVLRFFCDMTESESYEGDDRARALKLVNQLMDLDVTSAVASLLSRSNGTFTSDCIRFFDNLCEIYPSAGPEHLAERSSLIKDLVTIICQKPNELELEEPLAASELLSMVVHGAETARVFLSSESMMEQLLVSLALWRKQDPQFPEEQEWCENCHSIVRRVLLNRPDAKQVFVKMEGIELTMKLLKAETLSQFLALKLLRTAANFDEQICGQIIDTGGLKLIFPAFMGMFHKSKRARTTTDPFQEISWEAMSLISMLILCVDHVYWARVRQKFHEEGKMPQLIQMHIQAGVRVDSKVTELEQDDDEELNEDDEYLQLLESGLDKLQDVDVILARLMRDNESSHELNAALALVLNHAEPEIREAYEAIKKVIVDYATNLIVLNADASVNESLTVLYQSRLVEFASFSM